MSAQLNMLPRLRLMTAADLDAVEVIEQSGGARIIVEGYSFEVEQAAPLAA